MIINKVKFLESILGLRASDISRYNDVLFSCPNKQHSKPKLSVNLDTDTSGNWGKFHCWVCGKGMSGKSLISLLKRLKKTTLIIEYAKSVKNHKWLDIEENDIEHKEPSVSLPQTFVPLSIFILKQSTKYEKQMQNALKYLKEERDLSDSDIIINMLGISTNKDYYGYIVIPSFDSEGELNYFTGRSYFGHKYRYKNCHSNRISIIFNEINVNWNKELLLVEGPFDVIKSRVNATCLLGSALNKRSLLFRRIVENNTPILLSLDTDEVGKSKTLNVVKLLTEYGINTKIIDIKDTFDDIGDMKYKDWIEIYNHQKANNKYITYDEFLKRKIITTL
tara:strand:+ start:12131 stop:13135 length:1005 start_codon:yes stop_codon:yes gene_type:complete